MDEKSFSLIPSPIPNRKQLYQDIINEFNAMPDESVEVKVDKKDHTKVYGYFTNHIIPGMRMISRENRLYLYKTREEQ